MALTLAFDTETTGFPVLPIETQAHEVQPRIIQLYAALVEHDDDGSNASVKKVLSTNLNSVTSVPAKITQLTGIKTSDLHGAPQWEDVRGEFFSLVTLADFTVAHNIAFDARMIQIEEKFLDKPKPFEGVKLRCTLMKSRLINTSAQSHALGNLHKHLFGEELTKAHTAEADVGGLVRIYLDLIKKGAWNKA